MVVHIEWRQICMTEPHSVPSKILKMMAFVPQKFYVKEHAGNFMMHLMVEDADNPGAFACSTSAIRPVCCGTLPIGRSPEPCPALCNMTIGIGNSEMCT
jgi:hypothetical protein